MQWWTEARFGMFIHWGLYSLPARHEWVQYAEHIEPQEYHKYFELFNPDLYNPHAWAAAAKQAGMKYMVITAKHHEGFCLWDSKYTHYKVTNTPYGQDLIRPLLQAFREAGLRVGFYYSLIDWRHPEYPLDYLHPMYDNPLFREKATGRDIGQYAAYMQHQVRELSTEFGQIDCLFLDYSFPKGVDGKGRNDWQSVKLLQMVRELQPQIIVNDRLDLLDVPGGWDFRTPEQFKPAQWVHMDGRRAPWETCQTFSGAWGYHRDENTWKTVRQLLVLLIETVSKGGNLLLNVGPTGRGLFDDRAIERLNGIGEWMKLHSRSIYGCTQAPELFKTPENCLLTYNPDTHRLYIHILEWPLGRLSLPGFAGKVKYAQLLNDASEAQFVKGRYQTGLDTLSDVLAEEVPPDTLLLELPIIQPNVAVPVLELFLTES